jgi:hypothetical protein
VIIHNFGSRRAEANPRTSIKIAVSRKRLLMPQPTGDSSAPLMELGSPEAGAETVVSVWSMNSSAVPTLSHSSGPGEMRLRLLPDRWSYFKRSRMLLYAR